MPSDRRSNPPPSSPRVFMNCRLCWTRLQLEAARVERVESGFAYRCPNCDSSFLLRRADAATLGVADKL